MSEAERKAYESYLAYLGQELDNLDTAELEGRELGREEGKDEERIKTVRKLLKKGMSLEDISEITELTIHELEKLT